MLGFVLGLWVEEERCKNGGRGHTRAHDVGELLVVQLGVGGGQDSHEKLFILLVLLCVPMEGGFGVSG